MTEALNQPRETEPRSESDTELDSEVSDALSVVEQEDPTSPLGRLLHSPAGRQSLQMLMSTVVSVSERHSGPLPSPRQLQEYEDIVPGGAERIFQMAEREQSHRHQMQHTEMELRSEAIQHVKSRETRGQWFGAILAVGVLLLSAYLVTQEQYGLAVTLATTTMAAIAGVFVVGRWRKGSKTATDSEETD